MTLWSVKEGDCDPANGKPLGYISNCGNDPKRPMYVHYQAMATHFKGQFFTPIAITNGGNGKIKAWATKGPEKVVVMIMNQNDAPGSMSFHVRFPGSNSIPAKGSGTIDIPFNIAGLNSNAEYASSTGTTLIQNESTILLTFNCKGSYGWRHDYSVSDATTTPDPGFHPTDMSGATSMIAGQVIINPTVLVSSPYSVAEIFMTPNTFTYSWSSQSQCSFTATPPGTFVSLPACTGATPALYTYTVTDQNGCSMVEELSVTPDIVVCQTCTTKPFITVVPSDCGKSDGKANGDCGDFCGSVTYSWDGATPVSTSSVGNLNPGPHYVIIHYYDWEYAQAWVDKRIDFNVTISGTQPPVFAGFDQVAGKGCYVKIEASPALSGHTYEWFSGKSNVPFAQTYINWATHWLGENYRVRVTAPNGCVNEDWMFIGRINSSKCPPTHFNAMIPCDPNFNITARSMTEIETLTLSASATIEKNTYFDKILTVPAGKTLTIQHCVVAFSPSAHIIVADSGHIVVDDVLSFPCGTPLYPYYNGSGDFSTARMINSGFEGNNPPIRFENTNGTYIFDNTFARSGVAIDLDDVENAEITNNLFYETQVGIRSNASNGLTSGAIQSNTFMGVGTAIDIDGGDHTLLSIACNTLEYSEYGIYSEGSLGDFGIPGAGAANYFYSSSSLVNHQVHHNGNAITYHCGATNSFVLTTDEDCDVTVSVELEDQSCPIFNERKKQTEEKPALVPTTLALTAFPNPTDGDQTIVTQIPPGEAAVLSVYEAGSGRLILEQTLGSGETRLEVDLKRYAATVFAAVLRTSAGQQKTVKLLRTQ